jgi:hypothetical protein
MELPSVLLLIPKELLLIILNNTGKHDEDIDGDIQYPVRRDILQIYMTCKSLHWLSELWITYNDGYRQYDLWHYTIDIFGKHVGPQYAFYPYYENTSSQGLSGYRYVIRDYSYKSIYPCLVCLDNYFYNKMGAGDGILVVNGDNYNMDEESTVIMATQVLNQFKMSDPNLYQWSMENKWKACKVFVRLPIENYPKYNIDIPQTLIFDRYSRY